MGLLNFAFFGGFMGPKSCENGHFLQYLPKNGLFTTFGSHKNSKNAKFNNPIHKKVSKSGKDHLNKKIGAI